MESDRARRTPPHGDKGAPDPQRGHASIEGLRARGREVRDEGRALADATEGLAHEVQALAREQMHQRPYWLLGTAFAVGWVLGGGVPPAAVRVAGEAATRAATHTLATRLAHAFAQPDPPEPPEGA